MDTYQKAIAVGLALHLLKKYVFTPGWNVPLFLEEGWKYMIDSFLLCSLLMLWGPGIITWITTSIGLPENVDGAISAAPGFIGTVIGLSGGSIAYDVPLVGPILKGFSLFSLLGKKKDQKDGEQQP